MKNSYIFEQLPNQESEFELLRRRAGLRMEGFLPLLKARGLRDGHSFLELGCGHGIRTLEVAAAHPHSHVTGIDLSPRLLANAREMGEGRNLTNVTFQEFDITRIANLAALNGRYDFAYARLVFMHLPNPEVVLEGLRKTLKPGGILILEDADRDFMRFEPQPEGWRTHWERIIEGQRRAGGDPNIGTKLSPLLKRAGFDDVQVELQPACKDGSETQRYVHDLLFNLNDYCAEEERPHGRALIAELERLAHRPDATFYHVWFVASGRNPAEAMPLRNADDEIPEGIYT